MRLSQSQTPAEFAIDSAYVESLRAITDNGVFPLKAPRVGFFSTPLFFQSWQTNGDNQFRLNANQAMITALNLSFDAGRRDRT